MSDIVERLRNKHPLPIELEAAGEIDRLRQALLRIRELSRTRKEKNPLEAFGDLAEVFAIAYAATRGIKGL